MQLISFMDYIISATYGIVQGVTEFLPISSSGHLVVMHDLMPLPVKNDLLFDVLMHLATLLALICFFRNEIPELFFGFFRSFSGKTGVYEKLSRQIILSSVPACLAGAVLGEKIETVRTIVVVPLMLIFGGALFIIVEKLGRKTDDPEKLSRSKVLTIGLAQALALVPGVSRSGITVTAGMALGLKRKAAVRFSFLMAIPIILGANVSEFFKPGIFGEAAGEFGPISAGFIFAFVSGWLAVKYFLRFAEKHDLVPFAFYRFILAAVIMLWAI